MANSFFEKLKKGMKSETVVEADVEDEIEKIEVSEEEPELKKSKDEELKTEEKKAESKKSSLKEKEEIKNKKEKLFQQEGELAVDVYQLEEELVVQSAIAGVNIDELDISLENDVIFIKGEREKPAEKEEGKYFYQECYWGPFSRQIISPVEIDPSRAKAGMKNGILIIRIPKIQRDKKRKIEIKKE